MAISSEDTESAAVASIRAANAAANAAVTGTSSGSSANNSEGGGGGSGQVSTYQENGNTHVVEDYTSQGGNKYDTVISGFQGGYSGSGFLNEAASAMNDKSVRAGILAEANNSPEKAAELEKAGIISITKPSAPAGISPGPFNSPSILKRNNDVAPEYLPMTGEDFAQVPPGAYNIRKERTPAGDVVLWDAPDQKYPDAFKRQNNISNFYSSWRERAEESYNSIVLGILNPVKRIPQAVGDFILGGAEMAVTFGNIGQTAIESKGEIFKDMAANVPRAAEAVPGQLLEQFTNPFSKYGLLEGGLYNAGQIATMAVLYKGTGADKSIKTPGDNLNSVRPSGEILNDIVKTGGQKISDIAKTEYGMAPQKGAYTQGAGYNIPDSTRVRSISDITNAKESKATMEQESTWRHAPDTSEIKYFDDEVTNQARQAAKKESMAVTRSKNVLSTFPIDFLKNDQASASLLLLQEKPAVRNVVFREEDFLHGRNGYNQLKAEELGYIKTENQASFGAGGKGYHNPTQDYIEGSYVEDFMRGQIKVTPSRVGKSFMPITSNRIGVGTNTRSGIKNPIKDIAGIRNEIKIGQDKEIRIREMPGLEYRTGQRQQINELTLLETVTLQETKTPQKGADLFRDDMNEPPRNIIKKPPKDFIIKPRKSKEARRPAPDFFRTRRDNPIAEPDFMFTEKKKKKRRR